MVIESYYSRSLELLHIDQLTSETVMRKTTNVFAQHGIPLEIHTNGGTQSISAEFKKNASDLRFKDVTSSHITQSPIWKLIVLDVGQKKFLEKTQM